MDNIEIRKADHYTLNHQHLLMDVFMKELGSNHVDLYPDLDISKRKISEYTVIEAVDTKESNLIGCLVIEYTEEKEGLYAMISYLAVDKDYRHMRIATNMLIEVHKYLCKDTKAIRLYCRAENLNALNLYTKVGYRHTCFLKNAYGSDIPGYELVKKIT